MLAELHEGGQLCPSISAGEASFTRVVLDSDLHGKGQKVLGQ